jgi:hypothetical protein
VTVTVTSPALQGVQTFVTNEQGLYRFPTLPIGIYKITYEGKGFNTVVREQVTVTNGFNATINVTLNVATQQQTVVVTGETPLVDVQNTNVQNTFTIQQFTNVPNARDMWSIIAVTPGMASTVIDVGGSGAGTQSGYTAYGYGLLGNSQNRVQVDGVNTTEGTSAAGFYYDYGSFAEFTLGTAANDASMPVPGNQINAIIKTGGNQFHGTVYGDYENKNFQGTNISRSQLLSGAGTGTRVTEYHDPNGDIGGPILHDRLWFYLSLRDQLAGHSVTGFPAGSATQADFTTELQNITYKVSGQLSKNHHLSHYLQWGRKFQPLRNAANTQYPDAVFKQNSMSFASNIEYNGILSPKFFVTARVGLFGYNWPDLPYPGPDGLVAPRRTEQVSGDVAGGFGPRRQNRRRWQFEPTGSYFLDNFLHANHQLKFGWTSEREYYDFENYGVKGEMTFQYNSTAGGTSPFPWALPGDFVTPFQVQIWNDPTIAKDYMWHHGAYLQDQVKLNKRLTLNIGTRWDFYRSYEPSEPVRPDSPFGTFFYAGAKLPNSYSIPATYPNLVIPERTVLRYPALFVPRIGIAWDLFGNGKTILKMNWGRAYSNPATSFGQNVNGVQESSYTFAWTNPTNAPFSWSQVGATPVSNTGGSVLVQPHIKAPVGNDAGITLEHQFGNDLSIRVAYIYKDIRHDWQLVDIGRPESLFTMQKTFYDPGPDGLGTAASPGSDDQGFITVWDIPRDANGKVPVSQLEYMTPDGNNQYYRNYEITVNKRMSRRFMAVFSYYYTFASYNMLRSSPANSFPSGVATNPDMVINNGVHTTNWASHITGTYSAPWGIQVSPILRMQSGTPLQRYLPVSGLNIGTIYIPVDPVQAYRTDNIYVFDTRFQKDFRIGERYRISGIIDLFNMFNTNADQNQDNVTGRRTATLPDGSKNSYQRFLAPTTVVPPRVLRLGVRFTF